MPKYINLHKNYTSIRGSYQLKLPLNIEYMDFTDLYSNNYSKTDNDATFVRMKEYAMKNGQLKPAYNGQHGVDCEYIVWLTVGHKTTDTTTLIPFIKSMENLLYFKCSNTTADAGYESEENYVYIKENIQLPFIKSANYKISKTKKYKSNQLEGSFGEIKQDMGFRRYLSKCKNNVLTESILLAMAHNVNKLHNKIQSDRTETHLFLIKKSA